MDEHILIFDFNKKGIVLDCKNYGDVMNLLNPARFILASVKMLFPEDIAEQSIKCIQQAIQDDEVHTMTYRIEDHIYTAAFLRRGALNVVRCKIQATGTV